jgi:hypothetical protein
MSSTTSTILAVLLTAATSFALTDLASARPARPRESVHRPMHSAPVYLDHGSHPRWGDPGYYKGWVPPPAHAGGVG